MVYTDYKFYKTKYFGDVIDERQAEKWLSLSSDELDALTFGRLINNFPTNEKHAEKVQKAVCAVAEALFRIDEQRQASLAQKGEDGKYHGAVTSISSGRESVSFATGNNTSAYALAVSNNDEQIKLLRGIAEKYISSIPDSTGVNLMYAGGDGYVL